MLNGKKPPDDLRHLQLVGVKEVTRLLRIGSRQLYNLVRAGEFLPPIRIGKQKLAWRVVDLEAFLREREVRPAERLSLITAAVRQRRNAEALQRIEASFADARREASAGRS
jgi:predicted DNA-binding transcriptional regulator AlpA